jgi:hypothetical protein
LFLPTFCLVYIFSFSFLLLLSLSFFTSLNQFWVFWSLLLLFLGFVELADILLLPVL